MHPVWIIATLAGLSVLAVTALSRRVDGPWPGVVAAAPITPTASLLLLDVRGVAMEGVPVVAWTVVAALVLVMWVADLKIPATMVAFVAWLGRDAITGPVATAVVLAGAGLMMVVGRAVPRARVGPRLLRVWVRFALGSGSILAVWTLAHLYPSWGSYLALAPWLFVLGTLAAWLDRGPQVAAQVLRGGTLGAVGIVAFAFMVDASTGSLWVAVLLGWCGYLGVTLTLSLLTQRWGATRSVAPVPQAAR